MTSSLPSPAYDTVADLPYDSKCLQSLTTGQQEINIKSINSCRMETMYNTNCMTRKVHHPHHHKIFSKWTFSLPDEFLVPSVPRWADGVHHIKTSGIRKPSERRGNVSLITSHQTAINSKWPRIIPGSHVGRLPVSGERGAPQNSDCNDDDNLQKDLWQFGYPVEVRIMNQSPMRQRFLFSNIHHHNNSFVSDTPASIWQYNFLTQILCCHPPSPS